MIAFQKLETEYSNASSQFAIGNTLIDLMNQKQDIGGLNYKDFVFLINKSQEQDSKASEELEYSYLYYLLVNKAVLIWAAFGRTGLTKIEAIAQITGTIIEYDKPIQYADIIGIIGHLGVAPLMTKIYSPLENLYGPNVSEKQLHKEAKEVERFYKLAGEQFDRGNYQAAIELYTESINASQYVFERSTYINRGTSFALLGQYQKAIDDFNNPKLYLGGLDNNSLRTVNTNLGFAYYNLGNIYEAKKCYELVLSIDPNNKDAKFMLSVKLSH